MLAQIPTSAILRIQSKGQIELSLTNGGSTFLPSGQRFEKLEREAATYASVGSLLPFAGAVKPPDRLPSGWLLCNGSSILRTEYPRLYAIIGDLYGAAPSNNAGAANGSGAAPSNAGGSGDSNGASGSGAATMTNAGAAANKSGAAGDGAGNNANKAGASADAAPTPKADLDICKNTDGSYNISHDPAVPIGMAVEEINLNPTSHRLEARGIVPKDVHFEK